VNIDVTFGLSVVGAAVVNLDPKLLKHQNIHKILLVLDCIQYILYQLQGLFPMNCHNGISTRKFNSIKSNKKNPDLEILEKHIDYMLNLVVKLFGN